MKTKKILTAVLCLALLFIPTYIAIISYNIAQSSPVDKNSVVKMILKTPGSSEYIFDKQAETQLPDQIDGNMISFFTDMNSNASLLTSLPDPLAGRSYYEAVYYSYDFETVYKYYFSTDPTEAYYVDNNNRAYHITLEDAEKFIYSPYGIDLYSSAAVPQLSVGGTAVKPHTMTWQYLLSNNSYANAMVDLATEPVIADVTSSLDLEFSVVPDYLQVQVSNGDEILYNDLYSNISNLKFTDNGVFNVKLQAKWYDDSARASYGEAFYDFSIKVTAPAIFTLGTDTIQHGDFVVVSGKNVPEDAQISFTSEPSIGNFTPVFFRDGNYVRALIPISYAVEYSPTMKFTLECQGATSVLNLNVEPKTYRAQNYNISVDLIAQYHDGSAIAAFAEGMAPYFANKEATRYFDVPMIYPSASIRNLNSVKTGYGVTRTLTATSAKYRHDGVDFMTGSSATAVAVYPGKVIFAGQQTMSGRTVVVDHGYGLKTLYAHLNSVTVSEGDIVEQGQELGVVGNTGFTDSVMLHFGMYVFDVPVCPYNYFDANIKLSN